MYTSFEIPKKNGGRRLINSPNEELAIQKNLVKALYRYEQTLLDKDINIHSSAHICLKNEKVFYKCKNS